MNPSPSLRSLQEAIDLLRIQRPDLPLTLDKVNRIASDRKRMAVAERHNLDRNASSDIMAQIVKAQALLRTHFPYVNDHASQFRFPETRETPPPQPQPTPRPASPAPESSPAQERSKPVYEPKRQKSRPVPMPQKSWYQNLTLKWKCRWIYWQLQWESWWPAWNRFLQKRVLQSPLPALLLLCLVLIFLIVWVSRTPTRYGTPSSRQATETDGRHYESGSFLERRVSPSHSLQTVSSSTPRASEVSSPAVPEYFVPALPSPKTAEVAPLKITLASGGQLPVVYPFAMPSQPAFLRIHTTPPCQLTLSNPLSGETYRCSAPMVEAIGMEAADLECLLQNEPLQKNLSVSFSLTPGKLLFLVINLKKGSAHSTLQEISS